MRRTWNAEHRHWWPAALVCAHCGLIRQAEVRLCCARCPVPEGSRWVGAALLSARMRCGACGKWVETERRLRRAPTQSFVELACEACGETNRAPFMLRPVPLSTEAADLCFGLPLWLQTPCGRETLWAFNAAHLAFLRQYVSATVRERGPSTASAASRLPGWLKRAPRPTVLKAIARLGQLLD